MTLFTKCYPPPLGTRINNTVPALKTTTTVNRPVPALKKNRPSRREQKIQPPGPGAEKTQPPRPVSPRKKVLPPRPASEKKTTAPSRLGKEKKTPRPASGKKNDRPVPPRKKTTTAPSRLEKKKQPSRPAKNLPRKIPSRPVPPRISAPIFCQSRAPAEMKKVGQPSIFPPSRPVEILAVHVKPWFFSPSESLPGKDVLCRLLPRPLPSVCFLFFSFLFRPCSPPICFGVTSSILWPQLDS